MADRQVTAGVTVCSAETTRVRFRQVGQPWGGRGVTACIQQNLFKFYFWVGGQSLADRGVTVLAEL